MAAGPEEGRAARGRRGGGRPASPHPARRPSGSPATPRSVRVRAPWVLRAADRRGGRAVRPRGRGGCTWTSSPEGSRVPEVPGLGHRPRSKSRGPQDPAPSPQSAGLPQAPAAPLTCCRSPNLPSFGQGVLLSASNARWLWGPKLLWGSRAVAHEPHPGVQRPGPVSRTDACLLHPE